MTRLLASLHALGGSLAVVILVIAGTMLWQAARYTPLTPGGCWTVTDVAGQVTYFKTLPQFDVNVRAIKYEEGRYAGWIFPARVEEDTVCADKVTP